MPNYEEVNSCHDNPSPTDVHFWELYGTEYESVDIVDNRWNTKIYNQNDNYFTRMACIGYGRQHIENVNNFHTWGVITDPIVWWERICKRFTTSKFRPEEEGSSLQDNLELARTLWLIDGYYSIPKDDIETMSNKMMASISKWNFILCGSKKINWKETKKRSDWVCIIWTWYAHWWEIDGYSKDLGFFWLRNSDGKYYKLKFEDVGSLFTIYSVLDHMEEEWKQKIRAIIALKKKNSVREVREINWRPILKWRPK